ncbi:SufE family protein [bacterium endosymbiont of Pedicinus badii]|uniref:SufE family protein n=1 Tax=bacterium endosymbiont of Pedicinus badii TaxID=1719126 RepID=UPI0009BBB79A|nr:SufE family protein [bacterium endosymbiont of Pedicinus badii]OQM34394.1 hypothetical protein AOQ89_00695 [bacterium endosymbiont of Pedicinus badii]
MKKKKLLEHFFTFSSWEEKYCYIIELGKKLKKFPESKKTKNNLIHGCQNKSWIYLKKVKTKKNYKIVFFGESEALIVKGLMAILFIFYEDLSCSEIINFDAKKIFKKIALDQYLTFSRSQSLHYIFEHIKKILLSMKK